MKTKAHSMKATDDVDQYSVLLLPFRSKHQGIQNYFTQLMTTQDRRLLVQ